MLTSKNTIFLVQIISYARTSLKAVHNWHVNIHQYDVEVVQRHALHYLKSLVSVFSCCNFKSVFKLQFVSLQQKMLIIHQEKTWFICLNLR